MSVEGHHCLNGNVASFESKIFKHYLDHLFTISTRVHGWLGEKDFALFGVHLKKAWRQQQALPANVNYLIMSYLNIEFFSECVIPNMLHVFPVADDAVLHRIRYLEHGTQLGGFIPQHDVFKLDVSNLLFCSNERSSHNGGKYGGGKVGSTESAFDKLNLK